ncbi:MAG: UDP-N-acetylmuramate--L-alanine ligase [Rikenellaceae bacterium]
MNRFENIYFIGIGGIGMSSLARYFKHEGKSVAGYDRTETQLTKKLVDEGIEVKYDDNIETIGTQYLNKENTLVVYTPAIPAAHKELNFFRNEGFELVKRAKVLGLLSKGKYLMAVSGTHGKTSTTTMLAWFNKYAAKDSEGVIGGGSAFLGGISKNMNSNMILGSGSRLAVEADEFDRSFLQLNPDVTLVSSVDADHLDIYGTHEEMKRTFTQFVSQIKPGGALVYRKGIDLTVTNEAISCYTYALDDEKADFYAQNICVDECGCYSFNIVTPNGVIEGCKLGLPGLINVENCVGAVSLIWIAGFDEAMLKKAMLEYSGVKRRMDFYINRPDFIYIDDYAHHPSELNATISSIRKMFEGRKITAIFQPHLFTRTRDFADGFSEVLSTVDSVILLPIYPAREEPIEGVNSEMIFREITLEDKKIVNKKDVIDELQNRELDILVTFGAGDIGTLCSDIFKKYSN